MDIEHDTTLKFSKYRKPPRNVIKPNMYYTRILVKDKTNLIH